MLLKRHFELFLAEPADFSGSQPPCTVWFLRAKAGSDAQFHTLHGSSPQTHRQSVASCETPTLTHILLLQLHSRVRLHHQTPTAARMGTNPTLPHTMRSWGTYQSLQVVTGMSWALTSAATEMLILVLIYNTNIILILVSQHTITRDTTGKESWVQRGTSSPAAFQFWRAMVERDTTCNIPAGFKIATLL